MATDRELRPGVPAKPDASRHIDQSCLTSASRSVTRWRDSRRRRTRPRLARVADRRLAAAQGFVSSRTSRWRRATRGQDDVRAATSAAAHRPLARISLTDHSRRPLTAQKPPQRSDSGCRPPKTCPNPPLAPFARLPPETNRPQKAAHVATGNPFSTGVGGPVLTGLDTCFGLGAYLCASGRDIEVSCGRTWRCEFRTRRKAEDIVLSRAFADQNSGFYIDVRSG